MRRRTARGAAAAARGRVTPPRPVRRVRRRGEPLRTTPLARRTRGSLRAPSGGRRECRGRAAPGAASPLCADCPSPLHRPRGSARLRAARRPARRARSASRCRAKARGPQSAASRTHPSASAGARRRRTWRGASAGPGRRRCRSRRGRPGMPHCAEQHLALRRARGSAGRALRRTDRPSGGAGKSRGSSRSRRRRARGRGRGGFAR